MYDRIQVYFQYGLMHFLFQQLNDLFKSENPGTFYQNNFFPELCGTKLLKIRFS